MPHLPTTPTLHLGQRHTSLLTPHSQSDHDDRMIAKALVWALVPILLLLGLLSLVSTAAAPMVPEGNEEELLEKKSAGFHACCKEHDIFQSEEDAKRTCTYMDLAWDGHALSLLSKQKKSAWLKCLGDSKDNTECCRAMGGFSQSELSACNFASPFIDFDELMGAVSTLDHDQGHLFLYCIILGAYTD